MKVRYFKGDITKLSGDEAEVIVNAANPALLGGGGVDGSIHRRAGVRLKMFCESLPQHEPQVRCRVGEVVWTPAFDLPFKGIIHTVGPIFALGRRGPFRSGEKTAETPMTDLFDSLNNVFHLAWVMQVKKIALPAISCGIYGCTIGDFARILYDVLQPEVNKDFEEVLIPLFTDEEFEQFDSAWKKLTEVSE